LKKNAFSILGLLLILILSNCAPSSEEIARAVDATIAAREAVIPTTIPSETPDPKLALALDHKSYLMQFFTDYVTDDRYDPTTNVLHKYIDGLDIIVEGSNVHVVTINDPGTFDDVYGLALETLMSVSTISELNNWGVTSVDLIYPNLSNWEYRWSVEGPENITRLAEFGNDGMDEVMKFELSPRVKTEMAKDGYLLTESPELKITPILPSKTFVSSKFNECKDYSSGFVTCRIQKAYCSYDSSTDGRPTFCNDGLYPKYSFTYIVWGNDVTYLNGHCIIVKGKIEIYKGKPEITWQDNSGFVEFCD
jgi:hypothetical protein